MIPGGLAKMTMWMQKRKEGQERSPMQKGKVRQEQEVLDDVGALVQKEESDRNNESNLGQKAVKGGACLAGLAGRKHSQMVWQQHDKGHAEEE